MFANSQDVQRQRQREQNYNQSRIDFEASSRQVKTKIETIDLI